MYCDGGVALYEGLVLFIHLVSFPLPSARALSIDNFSFLDKSAFDVLIFLLRE